MEGDWFVRVGFSKHDTYRGSSEEGNRVRRSWEGSHRELLQREKEWEKEERGGAGRRREWERGEGGGGRKEVGREEGRERIKATGNELTQAKTKTLERLGHEYPHLNKRSHLAALESPARSLDKAFPK